MKKDIELITGDGPGSVKELAEQVKELGDKVEGLVDTFVYDPKLTYKTGENAREGRHIYQALQDVPRDTPPPNPAYWRDIGEILETANGLAFQVKQNTTSIKDLDGKVTASASSLEALRAAARATRARASWPTPSRAGNPRLSWPLKSVCGPLKTRRFPSV